jgi:RNA polymerase sigma-70 factor (ECF subfamily)
VFLYLLDLCKDPDLAEEITQETFFKILKKLDTFEGKCSIGTWMLHLVLHKLEEPYKEVFQLRVFGELSFAQIATIFGKTETWARVTYHRAKLKIQERMDGKHE